MRAACSLSSLEGYAITTVKVAGVDHEFAAIPGVMEDMLNIILSLKQVRFIRTVDNQDAEKVSFLGTVVILHVDGDFLVGEEHEVDCRIHF